MAVLEVNQLTKFYGKTVGVKDVSFSVHAGEIFGFLGPNGAGKTTTIRLLLGLIYPHAGEIIFFGKNFKKNHVSIKQRIGYLPGDFSPYRNMTGIEFLQYMSRLRKSNPALREHLIKKLQLTILDIQKKIKYLSHGNRQKLGIIFAFEHDPELIILDEPTIGLDPLIQEAFYQILAEFQEKEKTIFLSSHILHEVEKICHQATIIKNGRIVANESIESLKSKRPRRLILELGTFSEKDPINCPGVKLVTRRGNKFEYLVEGETGMILNKLTELPVKDIIFPEPDLEDIFLTYYNGPVND